MVRGAGGVVHAAGAARASPVRLIARIFAPVDLISQLSLLVIK